MCSKPKPNLNSFNLSADGSNSPSRPQNKEEALADLENRFAPKGLLEIALLNCEPPQNNLEEAFAALEEWMKPIREEDKELGIGRVAIPYAPVWIPQTPEGIKLRGRRNRLKSFVCNRCDVLW